MPRLRYIVFVQAILDVLLKTTSSNYCNLFILLRYNTLCMAIMICAFQDLNVPASMRDFSRFIHKHDDFECEIEYASLDSPPPYTSFSYTWGSNDLARRIILDDKQFAVTRKESIHGTLASVVKKPGNEALGGRHLHRSERKGGKELADCADAPNIRGSSKSGYTAMAIGRREWKQSRHAKDCGSGMYGYRIRPQNRTRARPRQVGHSFKTTPQDVGTYPTFAKKFRIRQKPFGVSCCTNPSAVVLRVVVKGVGDAGDWRSPGKLISTAGISLSLLKSFVLGSTSWK